MKTRTVAVFLVVVACCASSKPAPALPVDRSLPDVLASVLAEVKGRTSVSVLLPSELPRPFSDAQRAVAGNVKSDEYEIALYFELGEGNAGFAASFGAKTNPRYSPRELPNVRNVRLVGGIVGYFRPVSCGVSCAPANLWWEQGGTLYQIQLKLPSSLAKKKQQAVLTAVANSSILAGSR